MYSNKSISFKQIVFSILLALLIIGCETNPLDLTYSWETYEQDKSKLRQLPDITNEDLFYLDKYIEANTLLPEYAIVGGSYNLLTGIEYRTLIDLSKVYIEEQREKLKTAPDSIQIKYLGLQKVKVGSAHYNLYEVTNLYHKRLHHMEGIWRFYHYGEYLKEFKEAYIVDIDTGETTLVKSDDFPLWMTNYNSIAGKSPGSISIKFIPRILKFADGTRENFILEP
ncbi:MAG: hypothetical protein F9K45_01275 [Melioribacteraceae bacterium]|nr:MAG: hypothetical protein F9K45_01275 [Melioribacteraceae bacterium]